MKKKEKTYVMKIKKEKNMDFSLLCCISVWWNNEELPQVYANTNGRTFLYTKLQGTEQAPSKEKKYFRLNKSKDVTWHKAIRIRDWDQLNRIRNFLCYAKMRSRGTAVINP